MYCPNCAAEASNDQKFCRLCGMELHAVAELVSAQTDIAKQQPAKETHLSGGQRAMVVWGMILTFIAVASGSSLKILSKEHIQVAGEFTPYLMVISLFLLCFGMGLMCYPYLHTFTPRRSSKPSRPSKSEPTVKLEALLLSEEPSSITEQTTEFLEASRLRASARDTAPHPE